MNKIQELIQQKLALEIANKTLQLAGSEAELDQARETTTNLESRLANLESQLANLEAQLTQARETITKLESQLETEFELKGGDE